MLSIKRMVEKCDEGAKAKEVLKLDGQGRKKRRNKVKVQCNATKKLRDEERAVKAMGIAYLKKLHLAIVSMT